MASFPVRTAALLLALSTTANARAEAGACHLHSTFETGEAAPATYLVTDHESGAVNIRAQPNTRAAVLTVCDNHGEAAILGKSGAWYRVRLAVQPPRSNRVRVINGYVHQSQVSLRHVYIVHSADGLANLRLDSNNHSEVEGRIPNGTAVIEFPVNREGDWHYVGVPGSDSNIYGFMHKSQLRRKAGR